MKKLIVFIIISMFLIPCCSYKSYNPEKPYEYYNYWNNEVNRKNSILYLFFDKSEEELEIRRDEDFWR